MDNSYLDVNFTKIKPQPKPDNYSLVDKPNRYVIGWFAGVTAARACSALGTDPYASQKLEYCIQVSLCKDVKNLAAEDIKYTQEGYSTGLKSAKGWLQDGTNIDEIMVKTRLGFESLKDYK